MSFDECGPISLKPHAEHRRCRLGWRRRTAPRCWLRPQLPVEAQSPARRGSSRPPPRMRPAHLDHAGLDDRVHLVRARQRPRAAIGQPSQPLGRVLPQPAVHRLARHPIAASDVGHRRPVVEDLQHRLIALLHHAQLHEHRRPPPRPRARSSPRRRRWQCQPRTGATVAQVPGPRPESVNQLPGPRCPS